MIPRFRSSLVLASAALLLPACLEADVQAEVKTDGSGTLGVGMKFSDKFVEIIRKLEKADPKQDLVKKVNDGMMKKPDAALLAAWEKAGLKVAQFEAVADEKKIGSSLKLEFQSLDLLSHLKEIEAKGGASPVGAFTLTRDDKGVYTLAMASPEKPSVGEMEMEGDEDGEDEAGEKEEAGEKGEHKVEHKGEKGEKAEPKGEKGAKAEKEADPADEEKKAAEAMELMGELMGEMQNFRLTVAMKVPGEVVDFKPETAGKKDGMKVTWNFDVQTMMEMGNSEDAKGGPEGFRVRFRMPEGQSIPESALTKAAAPKKADAPKAAPEAPKPAPGGDGK